MKKMETQHVLEIVIPLFSISFSLVLLYSYFKIKHAKVIEYYDKEDFLPHI